jgi:hypothetical protein
MDRVSNHVDFSNTMQDFYPLNHGFACIVFSHNLLIIQHMNCYFGTSCMLTYYTKICIQQLKGEHLTSSMTLLTYCLLYSPIYFTSQQVQELSNSKSLKDITLCTVTLTVNNKIGKVYSLEYTDIPKVFFTPHHVGPCCTNVIRGHCCVQIILSLMLSQAIVTQCLPTITLGCSCPDVIWGRCHCCQKRGTVMDGPRSEFYFLKEVYLCISCPR